MNTLSTIFDSRLWNSYLSIIDVSTEAEVPLAGLRSLFPLSSSYQDLSAKDLQEYSFMPEHPGRNCWITLQPGESFTHKSVFSKCRLYDRHKGILRVGKQYRVQLRKDLAIPRWSWGTELDLQGPFASMPMKVVADGDACFTLVGPQDEQDFPPKTHGGLYGGSHDF